MACRDVTRVVATAGDHLALAGGNLGDLDRGVVPVDTIVVRGEQDMRFAGQHVLPAMGGLALPQGRHRDEFSALRRHAEDAVGRRRHHQDGVVAEPRSAAIRGHLGEADRRPARQGHFPQDPDLLVRDPRAVGRKHRVIHGLVDQQFRLSAVQGTQIEAPGDGRRSGAGESAALHGHRDRAPVGRQHRPGAEREIQRAARQVDTEFGDRAVGGNGSIAREPDRCSTQRKRGHRHGAEHRR